jgi:hypothetical protein
MIGMRPHCPSGLRGYCFGCGNCEEFLSFISIVRAILAHPTLISSVNTVESSLFLKEGAADLAAWGEENLRF